MEIQTCVRSLVHGRCFRAHNVIGRIASFYRGKNVAGRSRREESKKSRRQGTTTADRCKEPLNLQSPGPPQVLRPTGKFATKKKLIETFIAVRQKTVDYVRTTNDPLKNHVANHPTWGDMTAYQWLIFIAVHADRHAAQLEEVKNDSNFPKI